MKEAGTETPLQNVGVQIVDSNGNILWGSGSSANAEGAYATLGMPPGLYFAKVENAPGHLGELWQEIPCFGCDATTGTPIEVVAEQTAGNINFTLTPGGGTISGRITDSVSAEGIQASRVSLYTGTGTPIGLGFPDGNGYYSVSGLPAGSYYASAWAGGYVRQTYNHRNCPPACSVTSGDRIVLAEGQTRSDIDFAMDLGGSITGTITDAVTEAPSRM